MTTRGQTATEYLIMLAVVILIALVVVGSLGGIPGIGGAANKNNVHLGTTQIGVTDFGASTAKSWFTIKNNVQATVRVDAIYVNGMLCWVPGIRPGTDGIPKTLSMGQSAQVACNTQAASAPNADYEWPIVINYTNIATQARYTITVGTVKGTSSSFSCPTNYVPVPGMTLMDGTAVADFCVMKYEAKGSATNNGQAVPLSETATSRPTGTPWVFINRSNAISRCQANGAYYDVISDQQWMVIAENILRMPINNLNSTATTVRLAGGHNDNSPAGALNTTATDDPVVSGCNLWATADNNASNNFTSTCQFRGSGSNYGYYGTGDSFSMAFATGNVGRSQMRTWLLSNGNVIWDVGGNAWEWTNSLHTEGSSNALYYRPYDDSSLTPFLTMWPWLRPSVLYPSISGVGWFYAQYDTTQRVFLRGGYWQGSSTSGIFNIDSGSVASSSEEYLSFRCATSGN